MYLADWAMHLQFIKTNSASELWAAGYMSGSSTGLKLAEKQRFLFFLLSFPLQS